MVFRSLQAILGFLWIVAVAFELYNALIYWDVYSCYTKHEYIVRSGYRNCYMLTAIFALDMINATLSVSVHLISDLTLIYTVSYCIWYQIMLCGPQVLSSRSESLAVVREGDQHYHSPS
jgi:hypothetical protein